MTAPNVLRLLEDHLEDEIQVLEKSIENYERLITEAEVNLMKLRAIKRKLGIDGNSKQVHQPDESTLERG